MSASSLASVIVPPRKPWPHVEAALRAYPLVEAAIVAERIDRQAGRRLAAYLQTAPGQLPDAADICKQLACALPTEAVPTTLVMLDDLPLLPCGRPDFAALPSPDSPELGMRQYEAPYGPVEKAIAAIWRDLLGVPAIGRNAHFFELGGHSSLPLQLVYRLRQDMQVTVATRALFQEPVLHRFAALVSESMQASRLLNLGPCNATGFEARA